MGQAEDPYKVLMVDRAVDADILLVVYRRLVARYQPGADGGGWTAGRLAAVERAYAILRDPYLRARYDARTDAEEERSLPAVPVADGNPATQAGPVTRSATVQVVADRRAVGGPRDGVLDFGRYAGWSLRQLAAHDRDYLEWLMRSPGGRQYRGEITALLGSR